jgi:hypothetical protein
MSDAGQPGDLHGIHRRMGPLLFNRAWELLEMPTRTADEDDEMLAATLGQWYHWHAVGTARNRAVADWQVSRVAAELEMADLADRFARRSLRVAVDHGLSPFYVGYAHEAIARAALVAGAREIHDEHLTAARAILGEVDDPEERALLAADLDAIDRRS